MLAALALQPDDCDKQSHRLLRLAARRRLRGTEQPGQARLPRQQPCGKPGEIAAIAAALEIRFELPAQPVEQWIGEPLRHRAEARRRQPRQLGKQGPDCIEPLEVPACLCHPSQRRRDAAPRFDAGRGLLGGTPLPGAQPQRSGVLLGMRGAKRQSRGALRRQSPQRQHPFIARTFVEQVPCGGRDVLRERTRGVVDSPVVRKGRSAALLEDVDQRGHRRDRVVRRVGLLEPAPCRARGRGIEPLQRTEHVVAQHHVAAVVEDVQLHCEAIVRAATQTQS